MEKLIALPGPLAGGEALQFADRYVPHQDCCSFRWFTPDVFAVVTYRNVDWPRLLIAAETGQPSLV